MAKQFNPFHHWLGFDEDLTHPNHFQLFGVKSNLEDPIGFGKQVHAQAKKMLKQLEQMPEEEIGDHHKLHVKLRRHIVKAHDILLDDKLRSAYRRDLRQKAREAKGSAKPLAVPPPKSPPKSSTPQKVDDAASQVGASEKKKPKSSIVSADAKRSAVPMAIPLGDAASTGQGSFDQSNSEQIVIKPAIVKRKRSWLVPVLILIMTLFCIAGIGALVRNFTLDLPVASTSGSDLTDVDTEDQQRQTQDQIRKATQELVNATPEGVDEEDDPEAKSDADADADADAESMAKSESMDDPIKDKSESTSEPLSDSQRHSIRYLFERARKEMKRGRLESASEQYQVVDAMTGDGPLHVDDALITAEIKNGRGMIKHLEGFWDQVKRSSQKITGGELEPEPGVVIGFVEGREEDVVLRFGENVSIPYRSLRPGLAMLLAGKKAAPNVPAWRLQEAAFRLVHFNGSDTTKAKIEELVSASEADEYDGSAIRAFMASSGLASLSDPAVTVVSKAQLSSMAEAFIGDEYSKVSELTPEDALKFARSFSLAEHEDPVARIVALNETVKLSRYAGDAYQMMDAIDELNIWTDLDSAVRKADEFVKLVSKLPESVPARPVGEAFFEYLKSADATAIDRKKLRRLKQRVLTLVSDNSLDDLRRLISETMD